jgi:uncharacterized protein YecT (DUF1311 family)
MAAADEDRTEAALRACLARPSAGSTAGQTACEAAAVRQYDQRLNAAYQSLMRRLPPDAAAKLRLSQRAWLAFRTSDETARSSLFASREGTMYVPMQAAANAAVIQDRALQLERMLRVLMID